MKSSHSLQFVTIFYGENTWLQSLSCSTYLRCKTNRTILYYFSICWNKLKVFSVISISHDAVLCIWPHVHTVAISLVSCVQFVLHLALVARGHPGTPAPVADVRWACKPCHWSFSHFTSLYFCRNWYSILPHTQRAQRFHHV